MSIHTTKLNITKNIISIEGFHNFRCIEIHYLNKMNIFTLLPDTYIVKKANNRIIIINMNPIDLSITNNNKELDLIRYSGSALIQRAFFYDESTYKISMLIKNVQRDFWNTLGVEEGNMEWDYITRFWEDLDYDGNNNKRSVLHRIKKVDKEAKTTTTLKEIRKE